MVSIQPFVFLGGVGSIHRLGGFHPSFCFEVKDLESKNQIFMIAPFCGGSLPELFFSGVSSLNF